MRLQTALRMPDRIFGHIPGIVEGQHFENRIELSLAGVHRPRQAGISGSQNEGADSIVLSGGYEDDKDYRDIIVYTGHGGRDQNSGKQVLDQELTRQNLALAISCQQGLPVRVIKGGRNSMMIQTCEDIWIIYKLFLSIELKFLNNISIFNSTTNAYNQTLL